MPRQSAETKSQLNLLESVADDKELSKLITDSTEYNKLMFLAICKELEWRLSDDKGFNYEPTEKQLIFHKSPCKIRQLLGGNRAGKTTALVMETRWIALDEHPYRDTSHMKIIWVVGLDKINMLAGTIIPRFLEAIPERYIESYDRKNFTLYLKNGKRILFKSCDSGEEKFQSADVDVVAFDEEPKEKVYNECLMRTIDRGGLIYIAMTPTNGMSWSYEKIYKSRDGKAIEVVNINTEENPYLPKSEIDLVFSQLSPEEVQMRKEGKYISIGGMRMFPDRITRPLRAKIRKPIFSGDVYNGSFIEDDSEFLRVYETPNEKNSYYIGVDTSEGVTDNTAITVLRRADKIRLVAIYARKLDIELIPRVVMDFGKIFKNNLLVVERKSTGPGVLSAIKYSYNGTIYTQENTSEMGDIVGRKLGWLTSKPAKNKMIQDFRDLLSGDQIEVYDKSLIEEMENYSMNKKGEIEATTGFDDQVMSIMLAIQGLLSLQADTFTPINADAAKRKDYGASDRIKWNLF